MYVLWLLGNWVGTANIMVYIVQSFSKHGSLEENPEVLDCLDILPRFVCKFSDCFPCGAHKDDNMFI